MGYRTVTSDYDGGHLCCDVASQSKAKHDGADDAVTALEENSK